MSSTLLKIQNLSIDFKNDETQNRALHNLSLQVNAGEIVAVVGESGSGKSITSLSILQLLPKATTIYCTGNISFISPKREIEILNLNERELTELRGNKIAMIFQEPLTSLNPVHTCGTQVLESILLHQTLSKKQAKEKVLELFSQVQLPNPKELFNKYPHQISGGQKQRVMIAMAMSCQPNVLIADEPTTALDVSVQKNILQLLNQLQLQTKMGIIFITHDLGVVAEIAHTVAVLYKGKLVEQGEVKQIFTQPKHPYTKALLACRPILHKKQTILPTVSNFLEILPNGEIIEKSWEQKQQHLPKINREEQPVLQVKNVQLYYPSKKNVIGKILQVTKAVDDVSFEVFKGETVGLVGESGCGKSSLGRCIVNLAKPTDGEILFNNKRIINQSKAQNKLLRQQMQIVFQDPYASLNPRLKIGDALAEPLQVHGMITNAKQQKEKVIEMLQKVNLLPDHYSRYPHEFSGGQRQRIVIARALMVNPKFILFDESVSALDVSVQAQVLNLINDLKREFGFTSIFISHDLGVVQYISDRIVVMHKGKVVEQGNAEEVYINPKEAYTKQLLEAIPKSNFK